MIKTFGEFMQLLIEGAEIEIETNLANSLKWAEYTHAKRLKINSTVTIGRLIGDWDSYCFRVKPQPKHVPFEDPMSLMGRLIRTIGYDIVERINRVDPGDGEVDHCDVWKTMNRVFETCELYDPETRTWGVCGKLEGEEG